MTRRRWHPKGTQQSSQPPPVGRLIAAEHAVWRVTAVADQTLSDTDRQIWLDAGAPDRDHWPGRPYIVDVQHVGGVIPKADAGEGDHPEGRFELPAVGYRPIETWNIYPASDRWPMCSCCREPMPCRAELEDQEVTVSLKQVEKWATRKPNHCWGCNEPLGRRQKVVMFAGDNLDLPGAPEPVFHLKRSGGCRAWAEAYELRWLAMDPRRERILTWPRCKGLLYVHGDGSSECRSGRGPLGGEQTSAPDCRGHLTHDHDMYAACYVGDGWFDREVDMPGCPRGCDPKQHPGTETTRRPERPMQPAER